MNHMKGLLAVFLLLISRQLLASSQDMNQLDGHWICQDYLKLAHEGSRFEKINKPPFFELFFDSKKNTAIFSNGFETGPVSLQKNDQFIYDASSKTLLVSDQNNHKTWHFIKSDKEFSEALNHDTIAGNYVVKDGIHKVTFSDDGKVSGFKGFTEYQICYAGDCMVQNGSMKNMLILSNGHEQRMVLGWQLESQRILVLYQLKNVAEKGDMPFYKEQKKWMELVK